MPNWCNNTVTFRHEDPEMIRRVVDGYAAEGLFKEFHPIPDKLINTIAGFVEHDDPRQAEHARQEQDNLAEFGHRNWYDWAVANWGTKWDVTQEGQDGPTMADDGLSVSMLFDSAWAPPVEFYQHMTEQLGFVVEAYYYEPGMAFCGKYTSEDGDACYQINGNSQWVQDNIPSDINEAMCIAENMEIWEEKG